MLLVVGFHYWPEIVKGGYGTLDVFFVISGFVITGIIVKGASGDKVEMARFWSWRALRILPAALLVLTFALVGSLLLADAGAIHQFVRQIQASALYVENWYLAISSVNYFASELNASPVQHYWSLSVEEQFYLLWPVAIAAVLVFARNKKRALVIAAGAVTLTSLTLSVIVTRQNPEVAYFITPTRIWEITLGALLMLIGLGKGLVNLRALGSWVGIITLLVFCFFYDAPENFPGFIALIPALATSLVIWAGTPEVKWSPSKILCWRPVQWVGDHAYSIYLWHWPLLILTILAIGQMPSNPAKIGLVALTLLLSFLSKRFVEDPFRYSQKLKAVRPGLIIGGFALAIIIFAALASIGLAVSNKLNSGQLESSKQTTQNNQAKLRSSPECQGRKLTLSPVEKRACRPLDKIVAPTPSEISDRLSIFNWSEKGCGGKKQRGKNLARVCRLGDLRSQRQIAVLGDSHSVHWLPALGDWGKREGIQIVSLSKLGCSLVLSDQSKPVVGTKEECDRWRQQTIAWLDYHPEIQTVISANRSKLNLNQDQLYKLSDAYLKTWSEFPSSVRNIIVIQDTPVADQAADKEVLFGPRYLGTLKCLGRALDQGRLPGQSCKRKRSEVLPEDPAAAAALSGQDKRARLIDFTDYFCDQQYCYPAVGGIAVFDDSNHITPEFSRSLIEPLGEALDQAVK